MSRRVKIKKHYEPHIPQMSLPRCHASGGKLSFPTEQAASEELVECRIKNMFHRQAKRKEKRVYPCDHCDGWHLTAMAVPPKTVRETPSQDGENMNKDKNRRRTTPARPASSTSSSHWSSSDDSSTFSSDSGYDYGSSTDSGSSGCSSSSDGGSSSSTDC